MTRAFFGHSVLTKFTNNATWYEVLDPFGRPTGKAFRSMGDAMSVARRMNEEWAAESAARDQTESW